MLLSSLVVSSVNLFGCGKVIGCRMLQMLTRFLVMLLERMRDGRLNRSGGCIECHDMLSRLR